MVGRFFDWCRRRELKVNAGKINVMVMNGEEVLECDVHLEGLRLEHVSKFKYLECVLDEVGTDGKNVVGRWQVGRGWQVPIGSLLMLWICRLSVLESYIKHCLYMFLRMIVRQWYGRRRRDLGLGLYKWTTSKACLVLGGLIESRIHGYGNCAK